MKNKIVFTIAIACFFSCDDGWGPGGRMQARLQGKWKLDSAIANNKLLNVPKEMLDIVWNKGYHMDLTYRNDSLVNTKFWTIDPRPVTRDADNSILITYRNGLKRFYKIQFHVGNPDNLEATDYVDEVGSAMDTVKYYYTEIR